VLTVAKGRKLTFGIAEPKEAKGLQAAILREREVDKAESWEEICQKAANPLAGMTFCKPTPYPPAFPLSRRYEGSSTAEIITFNIDPNNEA